MSITLRSLPISLSWNENKFSLAKNNQYLICQDNTAHFIRSNQRVQEYIQGIGALFCIASGVPSLPRPKASAAISIRAMREFYQCATPKSPIMQLTRFVDQTHYRLKHKAEFDNIAPLGASIITAWIFDDRLHFMNIGNTRLYEFSNKQIKQHTTDQSIEHFNDNLTTTGARLGQAFLYGRHDNIEQLHIELGENVNSVKLEHGQRFLLCNPSLPIFLGKNLPLIMDSALKDANQKCKEVLSSKAFQDEVSAILIEIG